MSDKTVKPSARHDPSCEKDIAGCICLSCRNDNSSCCSNVKHWGIGCKVCEGECPDYEPEAE